MRELPILFSAPMVRAILEGRKTVTRRIVKPQPPAGHSWAGWCVASTCRKEEGDAVWSGGDQSIRLTAPHRARCPYGQPGDRLWVREAWQPDPPADDEAWDDHTDSYVTWSGCGSRIDGVPSALRTPEHCIYREGWDGFALKWRPGIHMPRWASRITLEVTGVRVERLQDISDDQALAEGIDNDMCRASIGNAPLKGGYLPTCAFSYLWEQINGAGSWDANPWVWVVEFKHIEQERAAA